MLIEKHVNPHTHDHAYEVYIQPLDRLANKYCMIVWQGLKRSWRALAPLVSTAKSVLCTYN